MTTSFIVQFVTIKGGGFYINRDMAKWLSYRCGWQIVGPNIKFEPTYLTQVADNRYWSPHIDTFWFRTSPDIINCIRYFQNEDEDWAYDFSIEKRQIEVYISLQHEKLNVETRINNI